MHLAVILPHAYRGGTLRGALNIARMLRQGSIETGTPIEVSFAHVDDPKSYRADDFAVLRKEKIAVRPFRPQTIRDADISWHYERLGNVPKRRRHPDYLIFNDGISNFEDCDFWLIISDRVSLPVPAHRRYALVIYDYIQRYVPQIFNQTKDSEAIWQEFDRYALAARLADFVICTTGQTLRDCVSYAGVEPERAKLFPMEFDPIGAGVAEGVPSCSDRKDLVLWTTNTTVHKNHENIVEGLENYFRSNSGSPLEVHVTGVFTDAFCDENIGATLYGHEYIRRIRNVIAKTSEFKRRVRFRGELPNTEYLSTLASAQLLLHGARYDNGTFSVLEAAWVGVPSLSSDYPAMREMGQRFKLPLEFFDATSPKDLANAMARTLTSLDVLRRRLPTQEILSSHSYDRLSKQYWMLFKSAMEHHGHD